MVHAPYATHAALEEFPKTQTLNPTSEGRGGLVENEEGLEGRVCVKHHSFVHEPYLLYANYAALERGVATTGGGSWGETC